MSESNLLEELRSRWQKVREQNTPERGQVAEELLDELYLLVAEPEPGQSPPSLEEACRGCEDLLPQLVERLRLVGAVNDVIGGAVQLPQVPGHVVLGELGSGGMGAVYRAYDTVLKREVAVKVLSARLRWSRPTLERFQKEAQVCSQLQHPNIVPVHAFGEMTDGRPYFTMKLVKGKTLAELLAGRSDPTQDLQGFLLSFQQVCQALAYAHSRGVLHRDLKPLNVMIGARFGEVLVMDWGIAKVFAAGGDGEEPGVEISREPGGEATAPGHILGTRLFMPPEQARGEIDRLNERTDVFALGAMLCVILTGRPPYEHGGQAAAEDLEGAFTRLAEAEKAGDDAELVALARECLAPVMAKRPADGGVVLERVRAYREGVQQRELALKLEAAAAKASAQEVQGRLDAEEKARLEAERAAILATKNEQEVQGRLDAEEKARLEAERAAILATKNEQEVQGRLDAEENARLEAVQAAILATNNETQARRLLFANQITLGVVALLAVLAITASLGLWWLAKGREAARADAATKANQEREARGLAEDRFEFAQDTVERMLERAGEVELIHIPLMEQARRKLLEDALEFHEKLRKHHGDDPRSRFIVARASRKVGYISYELGLYSRARDALFSARDLLGELTRDFPEERDYQKELARTWDQLGLLDQITGNMDAAESDFRKELALSRTLVAETADTYQLARTWACLATLFAARERPAEELDALRESQKLFEQLVREYPNDWYYVDSLANLHLQFGRHWQKKKRFDNAEKACRLATALRAALSKAKALKASDKVQPILKRGMADCQAQLANLLTDCGRVPEARDTLLQAEKTQKELAHDFPSQPARQRDLIVTSGNLGILYDRLGQPGLAVQYYRAATEQAQALAGRYPEVPDFGLLLGYCQEQVGGSLTRAGRLPEAEKFFRDCQPLWEEKMKASPGQSFAHSGLARNLSWLGDVLEDMDRFRESEAIYQRSSELAEELERQFPADPDHRKLRTSTLRHLGNVHRKTGRFSEAEQTYRKSLELARALVKEHPGTLSYGVELALVLEGLARVLHGQKRLNNAQDAFAEAVELTDRLIREYPGEASLKVIAVGRRAELGDLLRDRGRRDEAEKTYQNAAQQAEILARGLPAWASIIVSAVGQAGGPQNLWQVSWSAETMIEPCPIWPFARHQQAAVVAKLALFYQKTACPDQAELHYRAGIRMLETLVAAHPENLLYQRDLALNRNNLAILLCSCKRPTEAELFFRQALEALKRLAAGPRVSPSTRQSLANYRRGLAWALEHQNRLPAAVQEYRQALEVLRSLRQECPAVIEYQADLADAVEGLGRVLKDRQATEATMFLREARDLYRQLVNQKPASIMVSVMGQAVGLPHLWQPGWLAQSIIKAHEPTPAHYRDDLARTDRALAKWLLDRGESSEAEGLYREANDLYRRLVMESEKEASYRQGLANSQVGLGWLYLRGNQLQKAEKAYQEAIDLLDSLVKAAPNNSDYWRDLAHARYNFGLVCEGTNRPQEAVEAYTAAWNLRQQLVKQFPGFPDYRQQLAWTCNNLGVVYQGMKKYREAEQALTEAYHLRKGLLEEQSLVPTYRQEMAYSHDNLGRFFANTDRLAEGEKEYRAAIGLREQLAAEVPGSAEYAHELAYSLNNLGLLLRDAGRSAAAEQAFLRARAVCTRVQDQVTRFPAFRVTQAFTEHALGRVYADLGRIKDAEKSFNEAIRLRKLLADDFPSVDSYRKDLAESFFRLGWLFKRHNRFMEAGAAFQKERTLREQAVARNPKYRSCRGDLAFNLHAAACLSHTAKEYEEAECWFGEAKVLREQLVTETPEDEDAWNNLLETEQRLSDLFLSKKNPGEAEKILRESLARIRQGMADKPDLTAPRAAAACAAHYLGTFLNDQEKWDKAREAYEEGLGLSRKLDLDFPGVVDYRVQRAKTANALGYCWHCQKQEEKAIPHYREAVKDWQKLCNLFPSRVFYQKQQARVLRNQAEALIAQTKHLEAQTPLREVLALSTKLAEEYPDNVKYREKRADDLVHLARSFAAVNNVNEAAYNFRLAIQQQEGLVRDYPGDSSYRKVLVGRHLSLTQVLARQFLSEEAEDAYRQAIIVAEQAVKDFPEQPIFQSNLGSLQESLGYRLVVNRNDAQAARPLVDRAIACYRNAMRSNPDNGQCRQDLRRIYVTQAVILRRLRLHTEAALAALELTSLSPDRPEDYYAAADHVARCIPIALEDANLSEGERKGISYCYSAQAISLLRGAVEKGFANPRQIRNTPSFAAIKDYPDFQAVLAGLEQKGSGTQRDSTSPEKK